jgi:hypothetical protein
VSDPVATVPLALFDFVPVLLAGAGSLLLARYAGTKAPTVRTPALAAGALILAGGLSKAVWKLALAAGWGDWSALETGLFVLLAPGFLVLAWAAAAAAGRPIPLAVPVLLTAAAEGIALAAGSTGALLAATVAGATATSVLSIMLARRAGAGRAAWLFGLQLALAFALVPLAKPPHTMNKQWLEEVLNTFGQGAFALAAVRLARPASTSRRTDLVLTGSTA